MNNAINVIVYQDRILCFTSYGDVFEFSLHHLHWILLAKGNGFPI